MKQYWLPYSVLFLTIQGILYLSCVHIDFRRSQVDFKFLLFINLVFYLLGLLVNFLYNYFNKNHLAKARYVLQEVYIITFLRVLVIGLSAVGYWSLQSHKVSLTDMLIGFALYFLYTFVEKYLQIRDLRRQSKQKLASKVIVN